MIKFIKNELIDSRLMKRIKSILNNERGSGGVIEIIIFAAIIILAIIAIRPEIAGVFTDSATAFRTWIATKLTQLFT